MRIFKDKSTTIYLVQ